MVEPICAALDFPPSTYYAAKKRQSEPSARSIRDEELKVVIEAVWSGPGRRLYGARKVWLTSTATACRWRGARSSG